MAIQDRAFASVFSRTFVYNILFEDSEVDEKYLEIDEDSTILSISGAGCGVASMLAKRPRSIDAADINGHHLALASLKMKAAQHLQDYGTFYDLVGRGGHPEPDRIFAQFADQLPPQLSRYWKRHIRRFTKVNLYQQGLTAKMLKAVRRRVEIDADWLRDMAARSPEDRETHVRTMLQPIAENPAARCVLSSPVQLVALGINFTQRDRIVETEQMTMVDFFVDHLCRVMSTTDVMTNWFLWYAAAGHFNHDRQDAVPPYLRAANHEQSYGAPTQTRFHHGNLFDTLAAAGPETWSHYTLLDAVDWMPPAVQAQLFSEIRRTSRDGAIVQWRSVDTDDTMKDLGLEGQFERLPASDIAADLDRSRQYRQVNFYRVCH